MKKTTTTKTTKRHKLRRIDPQTRLGEIARYAYTWCDTAVINRLVYKF